MIEQPANIIKEVDPAPSQYPTLVHALETNERDDDVASAEKGNGHVDKSVSFRHTGSWPTRNRIRKAIESTEGSRSRLERWDGCGSYATVMQNADNAQELRIVSRKCRDRFCPTCGRERSWRIANALAAKVKDQKHRFITLTVKHRDEPLKELIDKLLTAFKALRRTPLWRTSIRAGAAFLEVKKGNGWHPHLHLVTFGSFIHHAELSMMWLKVTGDSSVVDIRLVKDAQNTIKYVTKYASKPLDHSVVFDRKALKEAIETLKGRKLLWTFGEWRGWTFEEVEDEKCWQTVCSLEELLSLASAGDQTAKEMMARLQRSPRWDQKKEKPSEVPEHGPPRLSS